MIEEYIECKICKDSVLKLMYRKHSLDHGVTWCKACRKQFSYDRRLIHHIEKSDKCSEYYRTNQLKLPVLKQENGKKKRERSGKKRPWKNDEKVDNFYICPTCQEDLLKPDIDIHWHRNKNCAPNGLSEVSKNENPNLSEGVNIVSTQSEEIEKEDTGQAAEIETSSPSEVCQASDLGGLSEESPSKLLNESLSEDITYDDDDPMSEESKLENSYDDPVPESKKMRFSNELNSEGFATGNNLSQESINEVPKVSKEFDINSSSDKLIDDKEVTLEERNSVKTDKEGKKKYSIELRISTIKRIEEEGINNLKTIAASVGVKVGVAHKWWRNKDKIFLIHNLHKQKARLGSQEEKENMQGQQEEEKCQSQENEDFQSQANELNQTVDSQPNIFATPSEPAVIAEVELPVSDFTKDKSFGATDTDIVLDKLQQGLSEQGKILAGLGGNADETGMYSSAANLQSVPPNHPTSFNLYNSALISDDMKQTSTPQPYSDTNVPKAKSRPCGMCQGCKIKECAKCRNCLDKTKFGGRNVIKQRCMLKVCEKLEEEKKRTRREAEERRRGFKRPGPKKKINGIDTTGSEGIVSMNPKIEEEYNKVMNMNQQYPGSWANYSQGNYNFIYSQYYANTENNTSYNAGTSTEFEQYEVGNTVEDDLRDKQYTNSYVESSNINNGDCTKNVQETVNSAVNDTSTSEEKSQGMSEDISEQKENHSFVSEEAPQYANDVISLDTNFVSSSVHPSNATTEKKDLHGEKSFKRDAPKFENPNYLNSYSFSYSKPPYTEEEIPNTSSETPAHQQHLYKQNSYGYEGFYENSDQPRSDSNKDLKFEDVAQKPMRKKRLPRCKSCPECKADDCGGCRQCLDMARFGGPGKLRKSCKYRRPCTKQYEQIPDTSAFKTVSSGSKDDDIKNSEYLLSSFLPKSSHVVVEYKANSKEHLNSLGNSKDFVNSHEISIENSEKHIPEDTEQDRTELENALGSIGAESNNAWMNDREFFMPRASAPNQTVGVENESMPLHPSLEIKNEKEAEPESEKVSNSIRFPGSGDVFFANEVTITKKVRHDSSQERSSSVSNSSEYPTSSSSLLSSWSQASSQQFSVASKQHPSLSQTGLSITKIGQVGTNDVGRKDQKSKELNKINNILSKLKPVPVSASVNLDSTQLNITAKDLDTKTASLYAGSASQDVPQYNQNYGGIQAQQVNSDTNHGYYDQFNLGYYQNTITSQPYQYSNQIFPTTSSYSTYPIAYGPATVTPAETSIKQTHQSGGFEDYINTEEASSIQDLLLNDTLNKVNNEMLATEIKVEVDEDAAPSTNQTVISFQNSISESLSVSSVMSSRHGQQSSSLQASFPMIEKSRLVNQSAQIKPVISSTQDSGIFSANDVEKVGDAKHTAKLPSVNNAVTITKKKDDCKPVVDDSRKSKAENIVTLFPSDMAGRSGDGLDGVDLTKTYTISKAQIDTFRTISKSVIKNEMTVREAGDISGLDEEIVKTWVGSLEDILVTNKEAVEKARKYDELRKNIGDLNKKIADLQSMVLLSSVVKKEPGTDHTTLTPLAENIPVDLSLKIPVEEQQHFTNVSDMLNKIIR